MTRDHQWQGYPYGHLLSQLNMDDGKGLWKMSICQFQWNLETKQRRRSRRGDGLAQIG